MINIYSYSPRTSKRNHKRSLTTDEFLKWISTIAQHLDERGDIELDLRTKDDKGIRTIHLIQNGG
jgi:hypothetical protein